MLLQSGGHIYTIAINIKFGGDDISEIDCDPHGDGWGLLVTLDLGGRSRALDVLRPFDRVKCAGEFDKNSISSQFDQSATVLRDTRTDDLVENLHPATVRTVLVAGHQDGVTNDVHERDSRQPSANWSGALFTQKRNVGRGDCLGFGRKWHRCPGLYQPIFTCLYTASFP